MPFVFLNHKNPLDIFRVVERFEVSQDHGMILHRFILMIDV